MTERHTIDHVGHFGDGVALADGASVAVESVLVESNDVAKQIIATAKKKKCDLICMASHGRRGISGVLLGSETHKVLTHSDLPVLVLR